MIQHAIQDETVDQGATALGVSIEGTVVRILRLQTIIWRNMHAPDITIQEDGER